MKAYKGFNKDMTCRGFQYEVGKTYSEEKAELCNIGFHACTNPLDCFNYYSPGNSVYHEVELNEVVDKKGEADTKICAKEISIGAKLDVLGICKAHFEFVKTQTTNKKTNEDRSSLAARNRSSLAARNRSSLAAQDFSSLAAQDFSSLAAQDFSSLAAQDCSSLAAGKDSILCAFNSKAKAGINSVITLANRERINGEFKITDFASAVVDGEKIKADTWYKLQGGEFVEVEEQRETNA